MEKAKAEFGLSLGWVLILAVSLVLSIFAVKKLRDVKRKKQDDLKKKEQEEQASQPLDQDSQELLAAQK